MQRTYQGMRLWERLRSGITRRSPVVAAASLNGETTAREESSSHQAQSEDPIEERQQRTRDAFDEALRADLCDLDDLTRLAWCGVPHEMRRTVWMMLLGYLPANARRRDTALRRKRNEFEEAIKLHFDVPESSRSKRDQKMLRQILVDAPRTYPGVPLFAQECIQRLMVKVLYVWSVRHPASGYVQGMNDLLAIFVMVFAAAAQADLDPSHDANRSQQCPPHSHPSFDSQVSGELAAASSSGLQCQKSSQVERLDVSRLSDHTIAEIAADTYWCLTKVLDSIHDHYTHGQPGLKRTSNQVSGLLRRVDADLAAHLDRESMPVLHITLRWINCLLTRELPLRAIIRLWDTCIAEPNGFRRFFPYICAAFLCHFSETLRQLQAEDLHLFLQDLPTSDWTDEEVETLLGEAYILSTLFQDAPSHLANTVHQDDLDPLARTGG